MGGTHRSRLLQVAAVPGLRPTPDRVRETLFNWLGQTLEGWRCLDLFAGSGVLGFEAASRGATEVVMVEQDARAYRLLEEAIASLPAPNVKALRGDAVKFLQQAAGNSLGNFDLIFLDPPYRAGWLDRVLPGLMKVAGSRALLYVEAEAPIEALGPWQAIRRGVAGQVHYQLMAQAGAEQA
ncbi:MAG: hypothetical protein RIR70_2226 [Pseudomonadota bacterium]